ncbi:MAG TPA: 1,4-alpha-glucan branching protein GlgB [Phycisphaerales bacterium]|nr:1,4-alpha-glucan branching protein GlgB [Phycisphaerales bacterium]
MTIRTAKPAIGVTPPAPARPKSAAPEWRITADDVFLFNEGTHYKLFDKLGAHPLPGGGVAFAVWAPNAKYAAVVGEFNGWNRASHPMTPIGSSGIWSAKVPEAKVGANYKFHIAARDSDYAVDKADPFGFMHETPPRTGSIVRALDYTWNDASWMASRKEKQALRAPMSLYEVHLGSWKRDPADPKRMLSYRELAPMLAEHCLKLGFTHVELLPIMEHPFYPSWGYQSTGYFAPTSRYGTPQDFMYLIDFLHQKGIGVVLDWVPSHFPTDEHGLGYFDGTHLYEHADPRQGFHPDWKSAIFNYGRPEVRAFLISSAMFWLEKFHADAIRVDAVASMLYLDYGRKEGEWIPNKFGGRENIEAVEFLRQFNTAVYGAFPDVQTIAEESTAWPMVSRPTYVGGLGFGLKWDMGWMHDTLKYFGTDPVHRRYHHNHINFRALYMFSEHYMLPLSHDEVVHLKGSLIERMPGDPWQRFANLRLLLTNQWTNPGKKLLFMGGEFAQWREWNQEISLDWHLTEKPEHQGIQRLVADLNRLYRSTPALHAGDCDTRGFEWVEPNDAEQSVLAFLRHTPDKSSSALVVLNCTPVVRHQYRVGIPRFGTWTEVLNSDAACYGGSGVGNLGAVEASPMPFRQFPASALLTLPPLGALILTMDRPPGAGAKDA